MPRPPRIPFTGTSGMPLAVAPGCRRRGCSLFSLLFLLLALLSLWKSCFNNNTVPPRIIHDTVYVDENSREDIIKKFLDTTTVFKTQAVELPNVQFYTNSAKLLPYSINSVQQLADYLNEHQQVHAVIEGHTDNVGDPAANLQLSQDRAETVRQLLISFGVEQGRVAARGYGKNRPRADNNTVEGRALNRRVEVRLSNTTRTETKRTEVIDE
jgi:outer membrane protein OmpA-like peptidoglycan-associated protein